jgi:hypothetical protein
LRRYNSFAVARGEVDYTMNNPLAADGSQLPCKRYAPAEPVATYTAGEVIPVKLVSCNFHMLVGTVHR